MRAVIAAVAIAFAVPVLLTPLFPGLDLPMHGLAASALGKPDGAAVAREFLGYVEVDGGVGGYALLYWLVDLVALGTGDAVSALQLVIALYVVGFGLAAYRLARAFELHAAVGLLAVPAAYSVVMAYGFLPYALGYPFTFLLWAFAREGRCWWGALLVAAALSLTHPFAAALAGPVALAFVPWCRERKPLMVAGAVAAGLAPAAYFALSIGRQAQASLPALVRQASLWDKWTAAPRRAVGRSVADLSDSVVGVLPGWQSSAAVMALAGGAVGLTLLAGRRERDPGAGWRRYTVEVVLAVMVVVYLGTPYDMQTPYFVAIQPRFAPLLWMLALLALRPAPTERRRVAVAPALAAGAVWLALVISLARFGGEARALCEVIDASAPRVRTLALVEQPPAPQEAPASPWRHAGAYLAARRGGYVAHMPLGQRRGGVGQMGAWLPVRRAAGVRAPAAPLLFEPRAFRWDLHSAGWDQFLIRDRDPSVPHDYFGAQADQVELVLVRGRWRLYRRR